MAKNTTKKVSITADNFIVHELASVPYKIYCELFTITKHKLNRKILTPKILTFDVAKDLINEDQEIFYFFDDFASVGLLENGQTIMIRQLELTNVDIRRRAWEYLLNAFLNLTPINPMIYRAIKNSMPHEIANEIFGDKLTIAKILKEVNLEQHHYDHQSRSQKKRKKPYTLPSFTDLIKEAQNESR